MVQQWKFYLLACILLVVFHSYCHRANAQVETPIDGQTATTVGQEKFFTELDIVGLFATDRGYSQPNRTPYLNATVGYQWGPARVGFFGTDAFLYDTDDYYKYAFFTDYKIPINLNWNLKLFLEVHQLTMSKLGYGFELSAYDYHVYFKKNENWLGYAGPRYSYGGWTDLKIFWDLLWRMEASYNTLSFPTGVDFIMVKTGLGYQWTNLYLGVLAGMTSPNFNFNIFGEPLIYMLVKIDF